jgi:ligand-binding sensor domain-containing protein
MKKRLIIFPSLWLLALCSAAKGQFSTGILKENTQNKDSITAIAPASITRTIKQDSKGNLWIAAFDGIFKYNKGSFMAITATISNARFFSVLEDQKGNFWFCSVGAGVYYFDGTTFKNFTTTDGLANNRTIEIYEDKAGGIWFGTESGASHYDRKNFTNYKMNGGVPGNYVQPIIENSTKATFPDISTKGEMAYKEDNDVNSIIEDKTGKFWFATRGNTCTYDGKTFTTLTHNGIPFKNVRKIIEDSKGNIWLGGNDGLWRYDGKTFTNFTQNFVGYIYEDKKGNIWISTETDKDHSWSLLRYEANSLINSKPTVTAIKTNERMIFGIAEAIDGSIWFGTMDGVHRYDGKSIIHFKAEKKHY